MDMSKSIHSDFPSRMVIHMNENRISNIFHCTSTQAKHGVECNPHEYLAAGQRSDDFPVEKGHADCEDFGDDEEGDADDDADAESELFGPEVRQDHRDGGHGILGIFSKKVPSFFKS